MAFRYARCDQRPYERDLVRCERFYGRLRHCYYRDTFTDRIKDIEHVTVLGVLAW